MFDTLLSCCVAYFLEHPDELTQYWTLAEEAALDQGTRMAQWASLTPPWRSPALWQRLEDDVDRLSRGSQAEQEAFFAAKRAALIQVQHGEHG
jgi:hypothetical protein